MYLEVPHLVWVTSSLAVELSLTPNNTFQIYLNYIQDLRRLRTVLLRVELMCDNAIVAVLSCKLNCLEDTIRPQVFKIQLLSSC